MRLNNDDTRLVNTHVEQMPSESTKQEKANALQLLERMDALDLAEMLGLVDGQ
jgi:hypothetical protein